MAAHDGMDVHAGVYYGFCCVSNSMESVAKP